jgi:phosphatidylserine/phosphatidylglycerophosphate/cardiolipin synthase-like enzyme
MESAFQVVGQNADAPFTLKLHRGEGMLLVAMNWRGGEPPDELAGFAIEYRQPGGTEFFPVKNRLSFPNAPAADTRSRSTRLSPIQKFRWVHFPRNAELKGEFLYRVTPVFMDAKGELSYGPMQEGAIELRRETYPGALNVAFTRGYVSSQAFVDQYASRGPISTLLPGKGVDPLTFVATHPCKDEALAWMGFEARAVILDLLDRAFRDDGAQVSVVAYDLDEPEVLARLAKLGNRLRIIVDDSADHGAADSPESRAAGRLEAGGAQVRRQHLGKLQHNKTILVHGPVVKEVICGSTNLSWRGLYVQSNNAVTLKGAAAIAPFVAAFGAYWDSTGAADFAHREPASWHDAGLADVDARVTFAPMSTPHAALDDVAADIEANTTSSLFYSLAFLYQTPGALRTAIKAVTAKPDRFVYGMSDKDVGVLDLQKPDGNVAPVRPSSLSKNPPEPFRSEPTGGSGVRLHHKFVVIDFDQPSARVYTGSYNFSTAADSQNGENLLLIQDRRVAVSFTVEALRLFDAYHFRVSQENAEKALKRLALKPHPLISREPAWWKDDYTVPSKIRDRELFA